MDSALNMDIPNIFKSNKFYPGKPGKCKKKHAVRHLKETSVFVVC